jgi:competence protein ComEC
VNIFLKNLFKFLKPKNIYFIVISCLILLLCPSVKLSLTYNPTPVKNSNLESEFLIYFFDVGKADCILIKSKKHAILIDAANKNSHKSIKNELENLNVKEIDLFIVTHPHTDHYGQGIDVVKNFKVKHFITSNSRVETSAQQSHRKLMREIKKNKIDKKIAKQGDIIKLDDIEIKFLGPSKDYFNINNNSVVAKVTYKEYSFLFMGDAEKESEKDIIKWCQANQQELKSNVIKIGHHGSNTSTSYNLLSSVKPDIAIITTSEDKFKLTEKVRTKLAKAKVKTISTSNSGTIVIYVDKDKINFKTENEINKIAA